MSDITANDEFYNHKMAILDLENEMRVILANFNIDASNMEIYEMAKLLKDIKGGLAPGFGLMTDADGNAAVNPDEVTTREFFDSEVGDVGSAIDVVNRALDILIGVPIPVISVRNCGAEEYNGDYADTYTTQLNYPVYEHITRKGRMLFYHSRHGWCLGTSLDKIDFSKGVADSPIGGIYSDLTSANRTAPVVSSYLPPAEVPIESAMFAISAEDSLFVGAYDLTGETLDKKYTFYNSDNYGAYIYCDVEKGWCISPDYKNIEFYLPDSKNFQFPSGEFIDATDSGRENIELQIVEATFMVKGCPEQRFNGSYAAVGDRYNGYPYYYNYNGQGVYLLWDTKKGWSFVFINGVDIVIHFAVGDKSVTDPIGATFSDVAVAEGAEPRKAPEVSAILKVRSNEVAE
jgi:hypothetical protein